MDNVMIDIETLGSRPGSLILSIGAVRFNPSAREDEPIYEGKTFYRNLDVLDSLMQGFSVDEDTCKWWGSQSEEAISILYKASVPVRTALLALDGFIHSHDFVWAKGPDFDLVILEAAYDKLNVRKPWYYHKARDVRTILHLGKLAQVPPLGREGTDIIHGALSDAMYQAKQVHKVFHYLNIDTTTV